MKTHNKETKRSEKGYMVVLNESLQYNLQLVGLENHCLMGKTCRKGGDIC